MYCRLRQDIESVAQDSTPAVRPGCVAAFSTTELGGELEVGWVRIGLMSVGCSGMNASCYFPQP